MYQGFLCRETIVCLGGGVKIEYQGERHGVHNKNDLLLFTHTLWSKITSPIIASSLEFPSLEINISRIIAHAYSIYYISSFLEERKKNTIGLS